MNHGNLNNIQIIFEKNLMCKKLKKEKVDLKLDEIKFE